MAKAKQGNGEQDAKLGCLLPSLYRKMVLGSGIVLFPYSFLSFERLSSQGFMQPHVRGIGCTNLVLFVVICLPGCSSPQFRFDFTALAISPLASCHSRLVIFLVISSCGFDASDPYTSQELLRPPCMHMLRFPFSKHVGPSSCSTRGLNPPPSSTIARVLP